MSLTVVRDGQVSIWKKSCTKKFTEAFVGSDSANTQHLKPNTQINKLAN